MKVHLENFFSTTIPSPLVRRISPLERDDGYSLRIQRLMNRGFANVEISFNFTFNPSCVGEIRKKIPRWIRLRSGTSTKIFSVANESLPSRCASSFISQERKGIAAAKREGLVATGRNVW